MNEPDFQGMSESCRSVLAQIEEASAALPQYGSLAPTMSNITRSLREVIVAIGKAEARYKRALLEVEPELLITNEALAAANAAGQDLADYHEAIVNPQEPADE